MTQLYKTINFSYVWNPLLPQMVDECLEGIEVVIITGGLHIWEARMFLRQIAERSLTSSCTIVLRMPFLEPEHKGLICLMKSSFWLEELGLKLGKQKRFKKRKQQKAHKRTCKRERGGKEGRSTILFMYIVWFLS